MVRLGSDAQFIDSIESKKALRVGSRVGVRLAARRASGAKVLLADLPFEKVALLHPEDPAPGPSRTPVITTGPGRKYRAAGTGNRDLSRPARTVR